MAILNNQMVFLILLCMFLSVAILHCFAVRAAIEDHLHSMHSIGHGSCMTASWSASFSHPSQTVNVEGIINPEIAMEKSGNITTSLVVVVVVVVVVLIGP